MRNVTLWFLMCVVVAALMIPSSSAWCQKDGCTPYTIYHPDGRIESCYLCCLNGSCSVVCF